MVLLFEGMSLNLIDWIWETKTINVGRSIPGIEGGILSNRKVCYMKAAGKHLGMPGILPRIYMMAEGYTVKTTRLRLPRIVDSCEWKYTVPLVMQGRYLHKITTPTNPCCDVKGLLRV